MDQGQTPQQFAPPEEFLLDAPEPPKKRFKPWMLAIAALVILIIIAAVLLLIPGNNDSGGGNSNNNTARKMSDSELVKLMEDNLENIAQLEEVAALSESGAVSFGAFFSEGDDKVVSTNLKSLDAVKKAVDKNDREGEAYNNLKSALDTRYEHYKTAAALYEDFYKAIFDDDFTALEKSDNSGVKAQLSGLKNYVDNIGTIYDRYDSNNCGSTANSTSSVCTTIITNIATINEFIASPAIPQIVFKPVNDSVNYEKDQSLYNLIEAATAALLGDKDE